MKQAAPMQSSFAMLFDPTLVRAAAERAAKWDLPRHVCRPLDRYVGSRMNSDLAAYDAAVELAPIPEEEMLEELSETVRKAGGSADGDTDFDDLDDL